MKTFFKDILPRTILPAVLITGITLIIAGMPVGCKSTAEGIRILDGDFSVPQLEHVEITGSTSMSLTFSKSVQMQSALVGSQDSTQEEAACAYSDDSRTVTLEFPATTVGKNYLMEGVVRDDNGNSLTLSIPFTGYNDNMAQLVFSEVRGDADLQNYMYEFVEFYVIRGGNLSGLEFESAGDGSARKYVFPAIDVSEGEYITLHLRMPTSANSDSPVQTGMVDELGSDLTASTARESCDTARDLWTGDSKYRISPSDVLVLRNALNGTLQDALLFALSSYSVWNSKYESILKEVDKNQMWTDGEGKPSTEVSSAAGADNMSAKHTLSRQNIPQIKELRAGNASEWIVTGVYGKSDNCSTPGYENSSTRYTKP